VIEIFDGRFRERLAERGHPFLPFLLTDRRQAANVAEVMHRKLRVRPQRAGRPAVETGHIEEHLQFSVQPDETLELGHKVLVIRCGQLPADANDEQLAAVFFIILDQE